MVSPTALYALLLLAAPLITIFTYSFLTDGYLTVELTPTIGSYVEAWTNEVYRVVMLRSLGVAMAVTMVIGNSSRKITGSLLTPGYTMASAIANQFTEADNPLYFSAIVGVAALLLVVSAIVNIAARLMIWQISRGGARGGNRG